MLEVKEVKKYFKGIKAVEDVSFRVNRGEIFGLLGPNGAGKSTTISMISTLLRPTSGDILYKGESILKNPKVIQKCLGIIPQEIALYPTLTGYQNLSFWAQVYGLRGKELRSRIEEVGELIGLRDRMKDNVEKYSGGMKRRLNIGAALLHKPEFLIMDEPTVGIDPQSRNHILNTVKRLNVEGMTIIYTSHYMEEVESLCNRISIMDSGEIIASGTKDELIGIINGRERVNIIFNNINDCLLVKLREIEYLGEIEVKDNEITLVTENTDSLFKDVLSKVSESDSEIISIDINKPNLETVFLHLTGKALRD